jgi:hypothetical protein
MMSNDHITAIQALGVATTEIASLDAELAQLLAAIRAFKGKAARVTRRVHARAEAISGAIHGTCEERAAAAPDVEPAPDLAEGRILDALAELQSAAPDDCAAATTEALTEYRKALRELVAAAGTDRALGLVQHQRGVAHGPGKPLTSLRLTSLRLWYTCRHSACLHRRSRSPCA